ncbi:MAG: QueT transporter family protein [Caldisericia bacterium]|nr:QueT transporter family protein [Caldisericia bacterium]
MPKLDNLTWIRGSFIGALYFVLTVAVMPLSFGQIQVRFSEMLTVLPFFFPEAIWGVTIGCLLSNIFSPFGIVDIIGGTICTFIAATLTYYLRNLKNRRIGAYFGIVPPILINGFGVAFYVSIMIDSNIALANFSLPVYFSVAGSIILGELVSVGIGGSILVTYLLTKGSSLYTLPTK